MAALKLFCFPFAVLSTAAFAQSSSAPEINPELHPKSDSKFFKKDYPVDARPVVTGYHEKYQKKYDFTHPYPIVQEDGRYDSDFVSDENSDGGEWRAQEQYDKVRIQIAKTKAEVERLEVKEKEAKAALDAAQAKEDEAEADSKAAEEKSDDAKKAADLAQDKEDKLVHSSTQADANLRQEMRELKDCRQELRKAKESLERRIQKQKGASKDAGKFEAKMESTQDSAEAAEKVEEKWEDKLAREKEEYQEAKQRYEKEAKDVKEVQALLDKAADRLRKFRAGIDQDGGVYRVDKNGKKIAFHHEEQNAARRTTVASSFTALVLGVAVAALP